MWLAKINIKLLIIFLLALFLRVYKLESFPPSLNWDEVSIGYNAFSISQTGKDEYGISYPMLFKSFNDYKLPGYIYIDSIFIGFLGLNEFAVRLPSAIFGAAAVPIFYLLCQKLFVRIKKTNSKISKNTPIIAAALLTISPWHTQFSRAAFEANAALTILLLGILLLISGLKSKLAAFLSMPALVLSVYFYYSQRLIVPLIAFGFFVIFASQLKENLKVYLISLLLGSLLFIPIGIHLIAPEGLKRVSEVSILTDQTIYSDTVFAQTQNNNPLTDIFLNYKIPLAFQFLHNYFSHFSWGFLFFSDDPNPRQKIPLTGNLYLFEIITLSVGFWQLLYLKNIPTKLFLLFWLMITSIAASLAKESPHSLRALPMVAPVLIISALGFQKLLTNSAIKVLVLTVMLASFVGYLVNYYYLYPVKDNASWGYGYKQLFMNLREQEDSFDKVIVTGVNWKPYIFYLFYNKINPSEYHKNENQTNIGKYVFGTTPWDNNGAEIDDNFIESSKGLNSLLALSPREAESLKAKDRFKKTSQIRDYSNRYVIYEIGQWQ